MRQNNRGIAHMLTPSLESDITIAEQYADAFAQAVLCPEPVAANLHARLTSLGSDALRIKHLKKLGVMLAVSPYTLYRASNNLTLLCHWLVFHNPSITLTTYN